MQVNHIEQVKLNVTCIILLLAFFMVSLSPLYIINFDKIPVKRKACQVYEVKCHQ